MGRARFELPKAAVRKGAHEKVRGTKVHEAREQYCAEGECIEEGIREWEEAQGGPYQWGEGGDEEA